MKLKLIGLSESQLSAVSQVKELLNIELVEKGIQINFIQRDSGIHILNDGNKCTISYEKEHQFIRALGLLVEAMKQERVFEIYETPNYDSLGVMIDCSRNAVLSIEAFEQLIKHLALMGYSTVQLYTEDTYEIKEYPYFGYMRGRYTAEQMKSMDAYAAQFGIELVPCIQTLAHLGSSLKWQAHSHLVDCNDILLIDEPKTYELIDHMFRTMSENLSSRKINMGMDEAHMMGLGKYLDKHGFKDRSSLMLKHFDKVMEIARKYGYKPMMWSDMYFRLASTGEYYDVNSPIREDIVRMIPEDITLVYWDYYSENPETYNGMMKKHKQLSEKIIFAGGAWKWMGFSPNNQFSKYIGEMAHNSCVANGIKDVLITAWGDNGAECSVYSILPSLQLWAELCYKNSIEESQLKMRFTTCVDGNYSDFMNLDLADLVPDNAAPGRCSVNPSKYLLYQDVLCGLFDKHIIPEAYEEHYRNTAELTKQAGKFNPRWSVIFDTSYSLCRFLEIKSGVGIKIRNAYSDGDKKALEQLCLEVLPELKTRAEQFMSAYRKQWVRENKIFGLDVFDLRMGGQLQRIESAIQRIKGYLNNEFAHLEELEQEILYFDGREAEREDKAISANLWHTIATPSVIAGV